MPPPARLIRKEIAERGPISFARFMELALYCPECGYYEKEGDNTGRGGDFFTSVSVGSLFGELLAFQFSKWSGEAGIRNEGCGSLRLVEAGAHDGQLAVDILAWYERQRPDLFAKLDYCILEPSARRRVWQEDALAAFKGHVRWLESFRDSQPARGAPQFTIIFANELLDAMPVHRLGWDAGKREWYEWGVTAEGERFVWSRLAASPLLDGWATGTVQLVPTAPELLDVLPDGFIIEVSPAAESWWDAASRWLPRGKLLTFDYGFDAAGSLLPERSSGTVRAYRDHQIAGDVLADPGAQDITVHVDFPRIEAVGVAAGLKTERFESQGGFLTRIAAEGWKSGNALGQWNSKRTRQFLTLTHPEHLGRSFRVLVQSRGGGFSL